MKISVMYSTMIVDSLRDSVKFYRDVLGFTEGYHVDLPVGAITIMNSPGGASVELIEAKIYPTGLYSVGCDVDDLDEAIEKLRENGLEPEGGIAHTTVGRQVFVLDPSGNRLCLIEHSESYREEYMG